ncbi:hypothetical protein QBC34DRAFT_467715 [Podospora aff. communis PSN243]|uniref:Uncharacterized protein n=1 Tax=Podospora aff. communis PSN243 TaxID=3040156 RepID=A0AAV9GIM5_9PEZI|nr:hypothetical protein QBC34DRAFT_467715 [Podospora aff. communis PSN243]
MIPLIVAICALALAGTAFAAPPHTALGTAPITPVDVPLCCKPGCKECLEFPCRDFAQVCAAAEEYNTCCPIGVSQSGEPVNATGEAITKTTIAARQLTSLDENASVGPGLPWCCKPDCKECLKFPCRHSLHICALAEDYNVCCFLELSQWGEPINAKGEAVTMVSAEDVGIDPPKTVGPSKNLDPTLKPSRTPPRTGNDFGDDLWDCCMLGCNECIGDVDCRKGNAMCTAYAPKEYSVCCKSGTVETNPHHLRSLAGRPRGTVRVGEVGMEALREEDV